MKFPELKPFGAGTPAADAATTIQKTEGPAPLVEPFAKDAHTFQPTNNGLVYTGTVTFTHNGSTSTCGCGCVQRSDARRRRSLLTGRRAGADPE